MDVTHLFTATLATVIELSFFTTTHLPSSIRSDGGAMVVLVKKTRCQAKCWNPFIIPRVAKIGHNLAFVLSAQNSFLVRPVEAFPVGGCGGLQGVAQPAAHDCQLFERPSGTRAHSLSLVL